MVVRPRALKKRSIFIRALPEPISRTEFIGISMHEVDTNIIANTLFENEMRPEGMSSEYRNSPNGCISNSHGS